MANRQEKTKWENDSLLKSVKTAVCGIFHILNHHRNARIIFFSALFLVVLGLYLKISNLELFVLGVAIMLVFIAEVINTIVEDLSDLITLEYHPKIKIIKDIAAGVVLVAVLFAVSLSCSVFTNRILLLWSKR